MLLLSRQGKVRLSKWYTTYPQKERAKITRDITPLVLGRALKLCNFLDYQDIKVWTGSNPSSFSSHPQASVYMTSRPQSNAAGSFTLAVSCICNHVPSHCLTS